MNSLLRLRKTLQLSAFLNRPTHILNNTIVICFTNFRRLFAIYKYRIKKYYFVKSVRRNLLCYQRKNMQIIKIQNYNECCYECATQFATFCIFNS